MTTTIPDRIWRQALNAIASDFDAGTLDPDLADDLVADALNWNEAKLLAASVFDAGIKTCDDPASFTLVVRERLVNAMLAPDYRRQIARAIESVGRAVRWTRAQRRHYTQWFIYRWEHRNDPEPEPRETKRSLLDVLEEWEATKETKQ
jgi:hypothetical protein